MGLNPILFGKGVCGSPQPALLAARPPKGWRAFLLPNLSARIAARSPMSAMLRVPPPQCSRIVVGSGSSKSTRVASAGADHFGRRLGSLPRKNVKGRDRNGRRMSEAVRDQLSPADAGSVAPLTMLLQFRPIYLGAETRPIEGFGEPCFNQEARCDARNLV
jgi:hypothetical protein